MLTITPAQPPQPCIKLQTEAVARFRYPARCLTLKCPRHSNKGPLYMAPHTPQLSELDPALRTQGAPTAAHMNLQPCAVPGIGYMNYHRWP